MFPRHSGPDAESTLLVRQWRREKVLSTQNNVPKPELKLSGSALADLMHSIVSTGAAFRFQAKGFSMSPFIRDKDIITISQVHKSKLRTGDVAAVVNPINGSVIVHRIVAETKEGILLKGDNCDTPDGIFTDDAIIGLVTAVERRGKNRGHSSIFSNRMIAFLSRTRLLNVSLPLLRKLKSLFRTLLDKDKYR